MRQLPANQRWYKKKKKKMEQEDEEKPNKSE